MLPFQLQAGIIENTTDVFFDGNVAILEPWWPFPSSSGIIQALNRLFFALDVGIVI